MTSPDGKPQDQTVKLTPAVLRPSAGDSAPVVLAQPGQVVALADDEALITVDPTKVLDLGSMEQQLIDAGVAGPERQQAMKLAVEAQMQFLAHQLSTITWFLSYGEVAGSDPFPLRLRTVAYDNGHMEVTFLMGAPDDAPKSETQEPATDEAATPEPGEDHQGPPLEQPRDIAAGA